jgi:hypothetical protein
VHGLSLFLQWRNTLEGTRCFSPRKYLEILGSTHSLLSNVALNYLTTAKRVFFAFIRLCGVKNMVFLTDCCSMNTSLFNLLLSHGYISLLRIVVPWIYLSFTDCCSMDIYISLLLIVVPWIYLSFTDCCSIDIYLFN